MTSSPSPRIAFAWPVTLAVMVLATPAASAGPAEDRQRNLAATCTACHAMAGASAGAIPALAGRPRAEIVQKLEAFRDGSRPSTVMQQIARGYTGTELATIAAWFAMQRAPSR